MRKKNKTIERKNENKNQRVPIEKIVLATIATAGVIATVAIAPGIGPAFRLFGVGKKEYSKDYVHNALSRLKRKGLVKVESVDGRRFVRLTKSGQTQLALVRSGRYTIEKPRRWDGKWRLVIFDIKEHKRNIRDQLRRELMQVGFVKLQNSVWIYPYECEEFIKLLKADHRIGKDILYIVAERVEYDRNFKQLFGLT